MKIKSVLYILSALLLVQLQACFVDDDSHVQDTAKTNFNALWHIVDEHYCFFEYKGVDWDSVYNYYAPRVNDDISDQDFFNLCGEMLASLQDGHVNLASAFASSYYWKWFQDYPVNYDERIVHENYLNFDFYQAGGITYKKLRENIGYIYYDSFSSSISPTTLDYILAHFITCDGLIIDVRNNGGGSLSNVEVIASRFIDAPILAGYIQHKTAPAHDALSEPYAYYYRPAEGHILYGKPVVVLTNRHTFSAANNFVQVMKSLPQVTIIGDRTGGGSGLPFTYNLPNGWNLRLSASPILDADGNDTEWGIDPHIKVDMAPNAYQTGRDAILDCAIECIAQQQYIMK
ncbi:MAG: S41 family peptidase [Bacteroidaceae bacterium]|nr:S41 family peptidase [Bacteroidaceae bacterium]